MDFIFNCPYCGTENLKSGVPLEGNYDSNSVITRCSDPVTGCGRRLILDCIVEKSVKAFKIEGEETEVKAGELAG